MISLLSKSAMPKTITIRFYGTLALFCILLTTPAQARNTIMPAPDKAPRVPVVQQQLPVPAAVATAANTETSPFILKGHATILSSNLIKIDGTSLRLFGLVPPVLDKTYAAQATSLLRQLAQGTVTCQKRGEGNNDPLLASCQNEQGTDFGAELLRRGLAVTARGSLHNSDLALTYISAEESARAQHLALWTEKKAVTGAAC